MVYNVCRFLFIVQPFSLLLLYPCCSTLLPVFCLFVVTLTPPCLATGVWRAQCLPCCGGYLPGVLRLGIAHHTHAYGKPVSLHRPHSQFQIRANYEPWIYASILPSFCIHNTDISNCPDPRSLDTFMNKWILIKWRGQNDALLVDEGCIVLAERY